MLYMINARHLTDVMAVKDDLVRQHIHILLDFVVLDHDDHEINRVTILKLRVFRSKNKLLCTKYYGNMSMLYVG